MPRLSTHWLWAAALLLAGFAAHQFASAQNCVNCKTNPIPQPDLFYGYYSQGACDASVAHLYPAPLPVRAHVGHVYYTYQPLMPHEFLYPHARRYTRSYADGQGTNRTYVRWYSPGYRGSIGATIWP